MDSCEHETFRSNFRQRLYEDVVLIAEAVRLRSYEVPGDGCVAAARELILHACKFGRLRRRSALERRVIEIVIDQLKAVERVPLQLPYPHDARAMRIVNTLSSDPGDHRKLEELCQAACAGKRTIQRVFLRETGMTFGRWRQQLRLLHGLQRLAHGDKVSSAAMEAGYNSASAFIAVFRKQLAATPTRYVQAERLKERRSPHELSSVTSQK